MDDPLDASHNFALVPIVLLGALVRMRRRHCRCAGAGVLGSLAAAGPAATLCSGGVW